jgi:hypothetical protein
MHKAPEPRIDEFPTVVRDGDADRRAEVGAAPSARIVRDRSGDELRMRSKDRTGAACSALAHGAPYGVSGHVLAGVLRRTPSVPRRGVPRATSGRRCHR